MTTHLDLVTSVRFTEVMRGFAALDVSDPVKGAALGRQLRQALQFRLTITALDIDAFVADPMHLGPTDGYVESDLFGGRLPVIRGWFNLFVTAEDPACRRMLYRLHFNDAGGNPLTLVGKKLVGDAPGLHVWRDTSTLYFHVISGHQFPDDDLPSSEVAAGVIEIAPASFARQLTTFRTRGHQGIRAVIKFQKFFLGQVWQVYGGRLRRKTTHG